MRSTVFVSYDGFEVLDSSTATAVYGGNALMGFIKAVAKVISYAWSNREAFLIGFNEGYAAATNR